MHPSKRARRVVLAPMALSLLLSTAQAAPTLRPSQPDGARLERWLDRRWGASSDVERETFRRLLVVEDDKLWRAFLGHDRLDDDDLQTLVERIAAVAP